MNRANRIGTPLIYEPSTSSQAQNITQAPVAGVTFPVNNINLGAADDFQHNAIMNIFAMSLGTSSRACVAQWLTIAEPVSGNTTGIEISASIELDAAPDTLVIPTFGRLQAAPGIVMAGGFFSPYPMYFEPDSIQRSTSAVFCAYNKVLIVHDDAALLAGNYAHGFTLINGPTAADAFSHFYMNASIRQNQDQNGIEYTDTRR